MSAGPEITEEIIKRLEDLAAQINNLSANQVTTVIYGGHGQGAVLAAGVTSILCPWVPGVTAGNVIAVIGNGVIRRFYVRILGPQPVSGSLVLTLQKNLVNTSVVITIPASSPTGVYTSTAVTPFKDKDWLCISVKNNAAANSAQLQSFGMEYRY